jgi:hypothetical protein
MKFDVLIRAAFAVAALSAAGTYAWTTILDRADPVAASGVDSPDGFAVEGFGFNRQGGFICVTRRAENPAEPGQERLTMTFYELIKSGSDGEAKLYLVGSRALDYDQGPDVIKFPEIKGETPNDLKKAIAAKTPKRNEKQPKSQDKEPKNADKPSEGD